MGSRKKLYELVKDLQTLTGIDPKEWTVNIDDEDYPCEVEIMQDKMILNPNRYKIEEELEDDLNEMRLQAGLDVKPESLIRRERYLHQRHSSRRRTLSSVQSTVDFLVNT